MLYWFFNNLVILNSLFLLLQKKIAETTNMRNIIQEPVLLTLNNVDFFISTFIKE